MFLKFWTSNSCDWCPILCSLVLSAVCVPVGVQDPSRIPDSSMTASSYYSGYYPHYGRLHGTRGGGAWFPKTHNSTEYLQVDMGAQLTVCAVATQGAAGLPVWTRRYKLSLSRDGVTWSFYKENNKTKVSSWRQMEFSSTWSLRKQARLKPPQLSAIHDMCNLIGRGFSTQVFPGNTDRDSVVRNYLSADARYVRFYPVDYFEWPCLRVEVSVLEWSNSVFVACCRYKAIAVLNFWISLYCSDNEMVEVL